jgi:protein-tyrosine phosphatase
LAVRRVHPEQLWLGTVADLRRIENVLSEGVKAVVDLALEEPPARLPRDVTYCRFPIIDGAGNPLPMLSAAIDATVALAAAQIPTLVACSAGMSRTPAIAAAALAVIRGSDLDETLKRICQGQAVDVSTGLWSEIKDVVRTKFHGT